MAEGKKSFVAYSDWKNVFDELPNEDAGKLIKHIFAYVNDENPTSDDVLIRAVFANIKTTLKRDLTKWDAQLTQRKKAGVKSAEIRSTKFNERSTVVNEAERNSTVSVNVSVNDIKDIYTLSNCIDIFIEKTKNNWTESFAKKQAEIFYNFYESKNWMVGKNKMKSLPHAIGGWIARADKPELIQNITTDFNSPEAKEARRRAFQDNI
jgi:hypothetical protein